MDDAGGVASALMHVDARARRVHSTRSQDPHILCRRLAGMDVGGVRARVAAHASAISVSPKTRSPIPPEASPAPENMPRSRSHIGDSSEKCFSQKVGSRIATALPPSPPFAAEALAAPLPSAEEGAAEPPGRATRLLSASNAALASATNRAYKGGGGGDDDEDSEEPSADCLASPASVLLLLAVVSAFSPSLAAVLAPRKSLIVFLRSGFFSISLLSLRRRERPSHERRTGEHGRMVHVQIRPGGSVLVLERLEKVRPSLKHLRRTADRRPQCENAQHCGWHRPTCPKFLKTSARSYCN